MNFLYSIVAGTTGLTLARTKVFAQQEPAPIPINIVKDFVGAGHRDLSKVKEMVAEHQNIVHCTYDWGNGDFESAIEGAGHVGNKPIAEYLIENGSRVTLFVLTMLGKTQIVKSYIETYPEYLHARGAHGFTFLHHAQRGGEEAKELLEFFQSKGLKEAKTAL